MQHSWTCACCGKQQTGLPLDYAASAPAPWLSLPEDDPERQAGRLDTDLCVLGGDRFLRACLEIPVIGTDERFTWGVWVSPSHESAMRVLELWDAPEIDAHEPPRFGWLSTELSTVYGVSTLNLRTHTHLRAGDQRPSVELEPTDHPLAVEQRQGMTVARVLDIAARLRRH
jgi:hypothetical protein